MPIRRSVASSSLQRICSCSCPDKDQNTSWFFRLDRNQFRHLHSCHTGRIFIVHQHKPISNFYAVCQNRCVLNSMNDWYATTGRINHHTQFACRCHDFNSVLHIIKLLFKGRIVTKQGIVQVASQIGRTGQIGGVVSEHNQVVRIVRVVGFRRRLAGQYVGCSVRLGIIVIARNNTGRNGFITFQATAHVHGTGCVHGITQSGYFILRFDINVGLNSVHTLFGVCCGLRGRAVLFPSSMFGPMSYIQESA
mmetsp:Transcript_31685/g.47013  ORF Transcript_31685/g.47013 Transcript_31685/m.47013 type:complete len:250 (+) Transcript_31685:343-1092(+)